MQGRPSPLNQLGKLHIPQISTNFRNSPPIASEFLNFPYFHSIYIFCLIYVFLLPHDAFVHYVLYVLDAPGFMGTKDSWKTNTRPQTQLLNMWKKN